MRCEEIWQKNKQTLKLFLRLLVLLGKQENMEVSMRKYGKLFCSLICILSLSTCSGTPSETPSSEIASPMPVPKDMASVALRIVDGADTGDLVLAGERAGDVYALNLTDAPIYLDGEAANADALEDGMMAEITYSGGIQETFPAQLGNVQSIYVYSPGSKQDFSDGLYDLCGLYLQVLNDLWETDLGLNSNVNYVSVDLSQAPGELTDGEKSAIAWIFANEHQAEGLTLSYEELAAQGYLTQVLAGDESDPKFWQWENGVLFSITAADNSKDFFSLTTIKFNAEKWRGPLGAYFFENCSATWGLDGKWGSYKVGAEAIS